MSKRSKRYAKIPEDRETDIAELAASIANYSCPSLPIDPEQILRDEGITTSFNDYGDSFDGLLEHRGGRFHVYCNLTRVESRGSPRARFTLGHELGHFFIDDHRNALLAGTPPHESKTEFTSANPIEAEADHFASNLLMPTERFLRAAKKSADSLEGVLELARKFGTSVTSTAIRYARLGVTPCAVIRWMNESYSWKWLSPQVYQNRMWKTVEDVEEIPTDSPTGKALAAGESSSGVISAGSTASIWFPFVHAGSARDALLMEHAMSLGRFGVLTMLFPLEGNFGTR